MCQPKILIGFGKHGLKTIKIASQLVTMPSKKPVTGKNTARPELLRWLKARSCRSPQTKPMAAPQCSMNRNSRSPRVKNWAIPCSPWRLWRSSRHCQCQIHRCTRDSWSFSTARVLFLESYPMPVLSYSFVWRRAFCYQFVVSTWHVQARTRIVVHNSTYKYYIMIMCGFQDQGRKYEEEEEEEEEDEDIASVE